MLEKTFCIFPGIGPRTERYLWRLGVGTWHDFLARDVVPGFSAPRKLMLDEHVREAVARRRAGHVQYFSELLGQAGTWRLWNSLADDALCMDIETDGRRVDEGELTVVGFYSRGEYRSYVCGENLNRAALEEEFSQASILVTYGGGGFDLPYLKAFYPAIEINLPHFDLCPAGHRLGLKGGLKKIEKLLGVARDGSVEGVDGYAAILLWNAHKNGKPGALERLVNYNREDTVNLHPLAWTMHDMLLDASGLPALSAAAQARGARGLAHAGA